VTSFGYSPFNTLIVWHLKSKETLQVSIVAASSCRYLYWQRSALEYLLVKESYLATVLTTLVARDIATKLYAMNNKVYFWGEMRNPSQDAFYCYNLDNLMAFRAFDRLCASCANLSFRFLVSYGQRIALGHSSSHHQRRFRAQRRVQKSQGPQAGPEEKGQSDVQ